MQQSPSWEANRFSASQKNSPHFIISESSLPHSQVPTTCPYPESDRSSPCPHIPLPKNPSYYYPPIYAWVSQVVYFPQVSPTNTLYIYLSSPAYITCGYNVNKNVQLDATVCRHLFTAKSLYTFRVSQHPLSGALKTVTTTPGIGHNTGTATSFQRGLLRMWL